MARYERRILVPYLCEVYGLELLNYELDMKIENSRKDQEDIKSAIEEWSEPPISIDHKDYEFNSCRREFRNSFIAFILAGIVGAIMLFLGSKYANNAFASRDGVSFIIDFVILAILELGGWCLLFLVAFPSLVTSVSALFSIRSETKENESNYQYDLQIYNENLASYNKAESERPYNKKLLQETQAREEALKNEKAKVIQLLNDAYGVNVIASKYRNKYATYYLYNYFSTSQEDDLDKIIQTFVLDEIKQSLDSILHKQDVLIEEIRNLIHLQEEQMLYIDALRNDVMNELSSIESSQDNQERYLRMIDSNVRVCAYLSVIDYLD